MSESRRREGGKWMRGKGEGTNRPICPGNLSGAAWKLGQNNLLTIVACRGISCASPSSFVSSLHRNGRDEREDWKGGKGERTGSFSCTASSSFCESCRSLIITSQPCRAASPKRSLRVETFCICATAEVRALAELAFPLCGWRVEEVEEDGCEGRTGGREGQGRGEGREGEGRARKKKRTSSSNP